MSGFEDVGAMKITSLFSPCLLRPNGDVCKNSSQSAILLILANNSIL